MIGCFVREMGFWKFLIFQPLDFRKIMWQLDHDNKADPSTICYSIRRSKSIGMVAFFLKMKELSE